MKDFVELRHVLTVIGRQVWLLVFLTLAGVLVGLLVSRSQKPVYEATATILVGQFIQSTSINRTDIQTSAEAAKTYADIALREPVLSAVVDTLALNQAWQSLKKQVHVTIVEGTQLMEVTAEASTPEQAADIAGQVAQQLIALSPPATGVTNSGIDYDFVRQQLDAVKQRLGEAQVRLATIQSEMPKAGSEADIARLETERAALQKSITEWEQNYVDISALALQEKASNNSLMMIEDAQPAADPVRPRVTLDTIIGGGVGLLLALGLIFVLEFIRDTYRSLEELYQVQEVAVLGAVGAISGRTSSEKIIAFEKPFSSITESYRMIRSRIQFRSDEEHPIRSILVTSPSAGDGKSITAANLAVVMAKAGHRTILVDADMRQPVLHELLNVDNQMGLADMLNPLEDRIDFYIKDTFVPNLKIITSGLPTSDPSERVGNERMSDVLTELEKRADMVILDSPPVLLTADATILASRVDGVVLVVRARKTTRSSVKRAALDLENADANLVGCILNMAEGKHVYSKYSPHKAQTVAPPARVAR